MIAMTTSSSMRVKAERLRANMNHLCGVGERSILHLRDQLTDDNVSAWVRGVQQKNDYDCKLSD